MSKVKFIQNITLLIALILSFTFSINAFSAQYTCPMHPHYISQEPGTCPICGMDLVQVEQDSNTNESANETTDQSLQSESSSRPTISFSAETIQKIGVKTAPAEIALFGKDIRSYGVITENKRLQYTITGRIAGWIESLAVTAVGDQVQKGDLLFTLYSPDLISAQQDYLAALSTGIKSRIDASEQRLKSLGTSTQVLTDLKKNRKQYDHVPFYSTVSGTIHELPITQGSYIQPGTLIARIQNYDSVWIKAHVAEKDLLFIQEKTPATVTFPNLNQKEIVTQVDYIYPTIDNASRTGMVRLVIDNQQRLFKPGSFADVNFESEITARLSIPSEAILKSAEGDYVILALGNGRFQPQNITIGLQTSGRSEILKGLSQEDTVVISSQFLIDSESSLRGAFNLLERSQTPLNLISLQDDQLSALDHLIDAALYIHKKLINSQTSQEYMLAPALKLSRQLLTEVKDSQLHIILEKANTALLHIQNSTVRSQQQDGLNQLVKALKPWILEGKPYYYQNKGVYLYQTLNADQYWIQLEPSAHNPYNDEQSIKINIGTPSEKHEGALHDSL